MANQNKVSLRVVQSDMRAIPYRNEFDAVINMFSSFGYFEKEKENFKVLKAVSMALKPKGFFLIDLPNKNWILTKVDKKTWQKINDIYILEERSFNNKKKIHCDNITIITPDKKIEYTYNLLRLYDFSEIKKELNKVDFRIVKVFGGYKAQRYNPKTSSRMIILSKKVS